MLSSIPLWMPIYPLKQLDAFEDSHLHYKLSAMKQFLSPFPLMAFVSGFVLLAFELAAARILAPSVGSSTYVWTSVIGVIIAALSVGYYIGGRLADRRKQVADIAFIGIAVAASIVLMMFLHQSVIDTVVATVRDSRAQGVILSLLLFAPTSVLIGIISPYLVKLYVTSLQTSGQFVANLSMLESIGGIAGTFAAGFILFGHLGTQETFLLIALVMMAATWMIAPEQLWRERAALSATIIIMGIVPLTGSDRASAVVIDTPSARYTIIDSVDYTTDRPVRYIATGPNAYQSGIFIGHPDELLFWYTQRMADITESAPGQDRILVLGGGTFTLPQYLGLSYPDSTIDVVEIDPELPDIARRYFEYSDPPNVNIITADARIFLNETDNEYDIILVDVFSDSEIPYTFITQQFGEEISRILKPDGVVSANIIAGTEGPCSDLYEAISAPYRSQFEHSLVHVRFPDSNRSNIITAHSNKPLAIEDMDRNKSGPIEPYTDNFAPAERLHRSCRGA
jgi:spermidine synthase